MAGCSSGHVAGPSPKPGYQSPGSAVAGFIGNLLRDRTVAACRYTAPDEQGVCTLGLELAGPALRISGQWALGNTAISGDRAIVDVEYDHVCSRGSYVTNSNPDAGLPGNGVSFDAAFQRAVHTLGDATDCLRIGGRWYVYNVDSAS